MMAVESPLISPPPGKGLLPAFSALPNTPRSPRSFQRSVSPRDSIMSPTHHDATGLPAPSPDSSNNDNNEPFINPSPIAPSSNGTDFTDLDEVDDDDASPTAASPSKPAGQKDAVQQSELGLQTSTPARLAPPRPRSDEDETPQSVIHAPTGFSDFPTNGEISTQRSSPSPSLRSDTTVRSPLAADSREEDNLIPTSPPPLTTTINPVRQWSEGATPRAQTRSEVDPFEKKSLGTNLEDIPEGPQDSEAALDEEEEEDEDEEDELDAIQKTTGHFQDTEDEIRALKSALAECWTLCNTLASLSYIHRERIFNFAGKGDLQENAWKSCWKLCQKLYDSRDDDATCHARPTLDLCRDFCQALFEVRVRENEAADSVLRVSFELNNHLYNTHDRALPEAFRERTLDFYITLCHRLMKQKSRMAEETDSLLRACWSLAEMLFSLRQNKMDNKDPDEELLGSAVQACWELCDLFREGWTQIRPDRGTPRASQTTFTQAFQQAKQRGTMSTPEGDNAPRGFPETPTTIFEDTVNGSPDEAPVPNIFVIGASVPPKQPSSSASQFQSQSNPSSSSQANRRPTLPHNKWSSASSTLSACSHRSSMTSATTSTSSSAHTITSPVSQRRQSSPSNNANNGNGKRKATKSHTNQPTEDANFALLRLLFIKAAQNSGFNRSGPLPLCSFIKSLPADSFGTSTWQVDLLDNYKKAVAADERAFRDAGPSMRAAAGNVARAVAVMVKGSNAVANGNADAGGTASTAATVEIPAGAQFVWLRDLFRLVFGFRLEQAGSRKSVVVQT